jgi:heterotetrameric sarcosine oxidase gamma subunit
VSDLGFLSPSRATDEAVWRSPLERALAHAPAGIEDVSRTGKLEVRGDIAAIAEGEVVRLTPRRALVLCPWEETASLRARLRSEGLQVVDQSAGYAGLRIQGATLMRRLTDLDLDRLPAAGALAHVQAIVLRDDEHTFRVFVPQEYGHYVAEVVVDAGRGVAGP